MDAAGRRPAWPGLRIQRHNASELQINAYMRESILVSIEVSSSAFRRYAAGSRALPVTISTQIALGLVYMQGPVNDSGPLLMSSSIAEHRSAS